MLHVARLTERTGRYYVTELGTEPGIGRRSPGPGDGDGDGDGHDLAPGGRLSAQARAPRSGRWTGKAAAGLGLSGEVHPGELADVLQGRVPGTARRLVRRRGTVAGFDLTFTAPKSASVLFALGDPAVATEVAAAHDEAVEAATAYVARRAVAVRRGAGEERSLGPVSGVVGAAFFHSVSRALDPHLHTHVVVANMGHGPDGRWTALDGRGLFAHAAAAGNLYDAHLRHRLGHHLGLRWTARPSGRYEIDGIGPQVIGEFSSRRAEILGHLAERGQGMTGPSGEPRRRASPRAARVAWAATRDPKDPGADTADLERRWWDRAAACDLEPHALAPTLGRAAGQAAGRPVGTVDEQRFGTLLVEASPGGIARRDAVAAWAGALERGAPVVDVERCCDLLTSWQGDVGVGEERLAPASVVPARHLLAALGPRPCSPGLLGVWAEAANGVTRYRARWGVTDRARPLGTEGRGERLGGMEAQRLADHLATSRQLDAARRVLGLDRGPEPFERALGIG